MTRFRTHRLLPVIALSLFAGCTGQIGDLGSGTEALCTEFGPQRVRRLTRAEFDLSASALLGIDSQLGQGLSVEDEVLGFTNHDKLQVSPLLVDQLLAGTQTLAETAATDLDRLVGCSAAQIGEDACARDFIQRIAREAFRRPVETAEVDALFGLYQAGRNNADFKSGITLVVEGVLQSPNFLYRTELGQAPRDGNITLTQYEVASALSFLVLAAPPDEPLLAAAEAGSLSDPNERERQVRRLLLDPRSQDQLRAFVIQWMGLSNLGSVQKDNKVFPDFSIALRESMRAETHDFIDYVLFEQDGSLRTLLDADFTVANGQMAAFYGIAEQVDSPKRLSLAGTHRAGLLTHASVLALYAHNNDTSPIRRGKLVMTRLLCQPLPPPPPEVILSPPPRDENSTTRERVSMHTNNPACAGCHKAMDAVGFGLEDFDGLGKYRTTDNGKPVDAHGELISLADKSLNGPFTGGAELARKLARSTDFAACANVQLYRYFVGRKEQPSDACAVDHTRKVFEAKDLDMREHLVALVRSNSFIHRKVTP